MSTHFLPIFAANADDDAEELRQRISAGAGTARDVAEYSKSMRIAGISALLSRADTGAFVEALRAGARCLQHWVDGYGTSELALSQCGGFVDALAANEWESARSLARALQAVEWRPESEYEEDFLYMKMLASWALYQQEGRAQRESLLERYRELEGDQVDWRLELCTALEAGDAEEFEAAFESLMLAERERFEQLRAGDALPPEELGTLAFVSVEGVALRRLGDRCGFKLQPDYLFVPSLALGA